MAHAIDTRHLGTDRVIAAWELAPGVIADPGPANCVQTLLGSLSAEPRALLLTHIHLDHAGAAGVLARRFPGLRVYVHEGGAPHIADPSRLIASATRLYGDQMERLWGEVAPVPAERVVAVRDGDDVEGCRVVATPGHARHHVVYLEEGTGDLIAGDVAGVRIPPGSLTVAPTPPPEIDVEAWRGSLATLRRLAPERLCLTHFGARDDVGAQVDAVKEWLDEAAGRSRAGDREAFDRWASERIGAEPADVAERLGQAMPPHQLWLGLERYWRKRGHG